MEINPLQLRRNLRAYYASRVDLLALSVVSIIALWLQSGMDLAQILLLQGIFGLFVMLLEFPSGVLADVTSRRKVLIIAHVSEVIALAVYLLGNSFLYFVVAEFFFGITLAFKSGSDIAMIYDSYAVLDRDDEGEEVIASGRSYRFASMVVLQIMGGLLATYSINLALALTMVGVIIQTVLYLLSVEPVRQEVGSTSQTTRGAVSKLREITMIRIVLVFAIFSVFLRVAFWDYIPRFELVGLQAWTFGFILAGANLIAFSSSMVVRKYKPLQTQLNIYALLGLIGVALWVAADAVWIVFVAILFHQVMRGGLGVAQVVHVNRFAETSIRASVHSLISALGNGMYFLFSVVVEFLDLTSQEIIEWSLVFTAILSVGTLLLGFIQPKVEIQIAESVLAVAD